MAIRIPNSVRTGLDEAFKKMTRSFGLADGNEITNITNVLNNVIDTEAFLDIPVNDAFSTVSTGGTLAPATYYYRVTAVSASGQESLASVETSQVVGAGTSTNVVVVNWLATAGAVSYNVYGRTTGAETKITASVGTTGLTYTDTGSALSGALPSATTLNTLAGVSQIFAGDATCVINNSSVAVGDLVFLTPLDNDASVATYKVAVTAGVITVTSDAVATANWRFQWLIVKKAI